MPALTPSSGSGRDTLVSFQEAATRPVRRRINSGLTVWSNLLWGVALLGLLLLPSDYRAGAETAHGHSLVQLWVDASDGTVHHAHVHHGASDSGSARATSWFDPLIGDAGSIESTGMEDERLDVADQQESAPTASGVHLLLTTVTVAQATRVLLAPTAGSDRPIAGVSARIVLPPPRWTVHAA